MCSALAVLYKRRKYSNCNLFFNVIISWWMVARTPMDVNQRRKMVSLHGPINWKLPNARITTVQNCIICVWHYLQRFSCLFQLEYPSMVCCLDLTFDKIQRSCQGHCPFAVCGVDFSGSMITKSGLCRVTGSKAWIAVIVCFSARATNLKLVEDLLSVPHGLFRPLHGAQRKV